MPPKIGLDVCEPSSLVLPFLFRGVPSLSNRAALKSWKKPVVGRCHSSNFAPHIVCVVTDNAGVIACDLPELMGRETWFTIFGHGYDVPSDGFGQRGVRLIPEPGKTLRVELHRQTIAKRLGRSTGAGIFGESQKLGRELDWQESGVFGTDSVQTAVHRGKLFWAWGDTNLAHYPLGIFDMTSATTPVQPLVSFEPPLRLKLDYFRDEKGVPRGVAKIPGVGPTWLTGYVISRLAMGTLDWSQVIGRSRLACASMRRACACGMMSERSSSCLKFCGRRRTNKANRHRARMAMRRSGKIMRKEWVLFGNPLPHMRCPASFEKWREPSTWETLEPQKEFVSAADGQPVRPHTGSIAWNPFRKRWVTVFMESFGKPSVFGNSGTRKPMRRPAHGAKR